MRMYDIIKKKRDGEELTAEEIRQVVMGYTAGDIPDYQMSALLMAIYYRGMSTAETVQLTMAIADSGERMNLQDIQGFKVDKHSSGGVGDKTTLVVAPIVAACGVFVAKMSGRGLGHTGGTIDKLEAIPGYRTTLTREEFAHVVSTTGLSLIGQSGELAPADKKLYALRDVTATVDSTPLIASSIMGKKLASADDGIVLDVKVGSGSFNKTTAQAERLAQLMVDIGKGAGRKTSAVISDMSRPLGRMVGNALEVIEAIDTLNGRGEARFTELCIVLAAEMLALSGIPQEDCKAMATEKLYSGEALAKFREMVIAQGGDVAYIDCPLLFDTGKTHTVYAPATGYITQIDTERYGIASQLLGAGRTRKDEAIDSSAGIEVLGNVGDYVECGQAIAILHANDTDKFAAARDKLLSSLTICDTPPESIPVVYKIIR